jgi:hypothetical protein
MKKFSLMLALVLFLLTGFYRFPYWPFGAVSFGEFKRFLYLLAQLMMVYQIRWREIQADGFSLLMTMWVVVHVANWLLRGDHGGLPSPDRARCFHFRFCSMVPGKFR